VARGPSVYAAPTRKDPERKGRQKIYDAGLAYDQAPKQLVRRKETRQFSSRLFQVLLGHAFCGEYSQRFRPKSDDPIGCACGHPVQTREHIIMACPLHQEHRWRLKDASPHGDHIPPFNTLISTKEGWAAIAEFLVRTSAKVWPNRIALKCIKFCLNHYNAHNASGQKILLSEVRGPKANGLTTGDHNPMY
jgi:hypothetical protein